MTGTLTSILGSINAFPLVARVLFPRATARIRRTFGKLVHPSVATQLKLERDMDSEDDIESAEGFTLVEMADMVQRLITDIGMTGRLSPLVIVLGHGSSSLNNPHESAYNCGACGRRTRRTERPSGRSNGNDSRVRAILATRG